MQTFKSWLKEKGKNYLFFFKVNLLLFSNAQEENAKVHNRPLIPFSGEINKA